MKILILTQGTRGDIQPYAVLGMALKNRGHKVTLATSKNFKELVLSFGITFIPIEADMQSVLESDEGKKMLKGNPFAIKRNLKNWIYPLITNSLKTFYSLSQENDLVLYHVKTLADSFADQFPHKMMRASVLPIIEPTNEFPNPSFSGLYIPKFLNKFSYTLSNASIKLLAKPIKQFRTSVGLPTQFKTPDVKNIYAMSPSLLTTPLDYPKTSKFNGFWFKESNESLSLDLIHFINNGTPPLLLTFGSMPYKCKMNLENAILKLTQKLKIRVIVVKGWGIKNIELLENHSSIKVIEKVPYETIFPYVKAVIHHGGIGTTAECLRAGKPFMICPILHPIGDQQFWGNIAYQKNIAVKPVPLSKITEDLFLERVEQLINNKALYDNSKKLKLSIDKEKGLEKTILEIETHYYDKVLNQHYKD